MMDWKRKDLGKEPVTHFLNGSLKVNENFADLRMGFGLGTVQARGACLIWMVLWAERHGGMIDRTGMNDSELLPLTSSSAPYKLPCQTAVAFTVVKKAITQYRAKQLPNIAKSSPDLIRPYLPQQGPEDDSRLQNTFDGRYIGY
ncbi:hypothetical protein [Absidia glauca]|uniref:Uncharacterized protein n=1 Tax=Absidia glauca TaxID=4829 RepID=A0A163TEQ5_ABSGL|nr:hypothetical protein [Absidia glauca]